MKKLISIILLTILLSSINFASFDYDSCINENYIKPSPNTQYKAVMYDYKIVNFCDMNTTILSLKVVDNALNGQVYDIEFYIEESEIDIFSNPDTLYYFSFDETGELDNLEVFEVVNDVELLLGEY